MDLIYHNGSSDITLNQIYTFIVVAEYGNFTKASAELHISQPSISKIISKLEEVTGLTIFIRNPRGAMLTPAGRILYQEWKKALSVTQNGYEKACSLLTDNRNLRIGLSGSYCFSSKIFPILQEFALNYPDIEIVTEEADSLELRRGIANEKYDVIFTPSYEKGYYEEKGYDTRLFGASPIEINISKNHPAANAEEFDSSMLMNDSFCTLSADYAPEYDNYMSALLKRHGFGSLQRIEKPNLNSVLISLIRGEGCFLACSSWFPDIDPDLFCRYSLHNEMGGMMMVWNRTATNPSISNLKKCIRY